MGTKKIKPESKNFSSTNECKNYEVFHQRKADTILEKKKAAIKSFSNAFYANCEYATPLTEEDMRSLSADDIHELDKLFAKTANFWGKLAFIFLSPPVASLLLVITYSLLYTINHFTHIETILPLAVMIKGLLSITFPLTLVLILSIMFFIAVGSVVNAAEDYAVKIFCSLHYFFTSIKLKKNNSKNYFPYTEVLERLKE